MAKQVLASCFTYHSQFLPAPAEVMHAIHSRIIAYVLGKGCPRGPQLGHYSASPPANVAALPVNMGGIKQVDIRAHAAAMQGRVAAAALHPRRAAWKRFFAANMQRAMPGLGVAALVQRSGQTVRVAKAQGQLSARHAAYVQAFQGVGLQRHIPHADMTADQVRKKKKKTRCGWSCLWVTGGTLNTW